MKKFQFFFGAFLLATFFVIFSYNDASAWYNKEGNCYKTQYYLRYKAAFGKDGIQSTTYDKKVYSTNNICYKNGKLTTGLTSNITGSGLKYPNFSKGSNDKEVKVTYCQDGPIVNQWLNIAGSNEIKEYNSCTKGTKTETFTMKDGESFKDFTARINNSLANKSVQKDTSIIAANKSDAKSEGFKRLDENGEEIKYGSGGCKGNAAVKALGWVLCPILEFMGDASDGVYNKFVEPLLQIPPTLFSGSEDEGVRSGWETFRNFANMIFVILLLFVIFSQITGVGIDNYGIKKILPKLIIAAVLINLSYILCILAVDISNIVGNGLQSLFNTLSSGLEPASSLEIEGDPIDIGTIATSAVSGVALMGAVVAGGALLFANPAILLSLLVSALGIVVSIFFLFILLTARQAAVVVLTVISPIAVVMYALPNTKNIFDKWLKLFEGLLLVYPIAGLLVGAGNYVSRLLLVSGLGEGSFVAALTAMIVSVIPIFFIPTVLKQSFAALGNLGSKISGIGQRLGGAAQGAARNSGIYNNLQRAGLERQTRLRAGLDKNGNQVSKGMGTLLSGGRRNRQRNTIAYRRMMEETGSLEATEGEHYFDSTLDKMAKDQLVATGLANNIGTSKGENGKVEIEKGGLTEALVSALRQGNDAQARAITDILSSKGEDGREAVKTAWNTAVQGGGVSDKTASAFANTIMSNHALDYKNNDRAMFDVARNISSNPEGNAGLTTTDYVSDNRSNLANKVTAGNIGTMDDNAFNDVFGGYNGNPVSVPDGANTNAIAATAYAALNDQNANIKVERREALQKIVDDAGYRPTNVQDVRVVDSGSSMSVPHGNTPTNIGGGGGADSVSE